MIISIKKDRDEVKPDSDQVPLGEPLREILVQFRDHHLRRSHRVPGQEEEN